MGFGSELGEQELNLLNGVQNVVGDLISGKLSADTFVKTVKEIKTVLPSLQKIKVVSVILFYVLIKCAS